MDFEEVISVGVRFVEAVGAALMVFGGAGAFIAAVPQALRVETRPQAYLALRRNLGRAILLGIEVLIVADIIRTILVESTVESVIVLGAIVVIRVVLSFSLEVEMEGVWPWSRWRIGSTGKTPTDQGIAAGPET